jgi:hypothetical protein
MKGIRKARRLQKRWVDVDEKNLNMVGIRNWPAVARDQKQWRTVLEAKVHLKTVVPEDKEEEENNTSKACRRTTNETS